MQDQRIGGLDAQFGGVDWGELTVAAPTLTFDARIDLHVDDLAVELHYIGDAGPHHRRRGRLDPRARCPVRR